MNKNTSVEKLVFETITNLNQGKTDLMKLSISLETVLFGEGGKLNSLDLVNLIVELEQRLEEQFDTVFTLADERAMSERNSPFRSVQSLIEFVDARIKESQIA